MFYDKYVVAVSYGVPYLRGVQVQALYVGIDL
jgi:hypothetical protein